MAHANETSKVRWICDKDNCKHVNIRVISKYHVIFEDICSKCDKYIHEPLVKIFKEKIDGRHCN